MSSVISLGDIRVVVKMAFNNQDIVLLEKDWKELDLFNLSVLEFL